MHFIQHIYIYIYIYIYLFIYCIISRFSSACNSKDYEPTEIDPRSASLRSAYRNRTHRLPPDEINDSH